MKKFLLLIGFFLIVQAQEIETKQNIDNSSLESLVKMNKGIKRDFYINKYFKKDINKDEALEALSLVDKFTDEMFYNFAKKFEHDETLAVAQCMKMDIKNLIDSYADCILVGVSINKMSKLSSIDIELIKQKTSEKYPDFTKRLKVFSSSLPFTKLIVSKNDEFYNIFLNVDDDFRAKYFDYKLPKRTFQRILKDKKNFEKFLEVSLRDLRLLNLQKSLLELDDSKLSSNSSFLLALNSIRFNNLKKAMFYLDNAEKKIKNKKNIDKRNIDKITFWKFQITTDKKYLDELSNSSSLNFYTLYTKEFLDKKLDDLSFLKRIDEFDTLLEQYGINRVSLLYSLAKVKSNFNSTKISKDFEIGIIQVNSNLKEELDLFSLKNNLNFANTRLDNIEQNLNTKNNPIFLSIAFDTNIDYLKKELEKGFFLRKNLFEPFIGLELLFYKNKDYLKDILIYKYLYQNYLAKEEKDKVTLSSILENLLPSSQK